MDDPISRLRRKVGALFDALRDADRELYIEITDLLLTCWDDAYAHGELTLREAEVSVDLATEALHDQTAAMEHVRAAIGHLRRGRSLS